MKDYARNKFQNEQKTPRHNKKQAKTKPTTQRTSRKSTQKSQPRQRIRQPDKRNIRNKSNKNKIIAIVTLFLIAGVFLWWLLPNNIQPDHKSEQPKKPTLRAPAIFNTHNTHDQIPRQEESLNEKSKKDKTDSSVSIPDNNQTQQNNQSKSTSQSMQDIANDLNRQMNELTAAENNAAEGSPQPKFSFYENLSTRHVDSEVKPEKAKQYEYTYMLQVGSYRSKDGADAVRARLLLLGLKPKVTKHGSWYRIDVGPVHSKRKGDVLKHKLEKAGISGSMLRQVSKKEVKTTEQDSNQTSDG